MPFKTLKYLRKFCVGYDDESWCFESHVDTIKCYQEMLAKTAIQGSSFDKEGDTKPGCCEFPAVWIIETLNFIE